MKDTGPSKEGGYELINKGRLSAFTELSQIISCAFVGCWNAAVLREAVEAVWLLAVNLKTDYESSALPLSYSSKTSEEQLNRSIRPTAPGTVPQGITETQVLKKLQ